MSGIVCLVILVALPLFEAAASPAVYLAWSPSTRLPKALPITSFETLVVLEVPTLSPLNLRKYAGVYAERAENYPLQPFSKHVQNAKFTLTGSILPEARRPMDLLLENERYQMHEVEASELIEFLKTFRNVKSEPKSVVHVRFDGVEGFAHLDFAQMEKELDGVENVVYVVVGDYSDDRPKLHHQKFEYRFSTLADSAAVVNITDGKYGPQYVTPNIVTGLLVTLFLVVLLFSALNCLMSLHTPLRYPHKTLAIKKEF
jgi:hypothetical protein